MVFHWKLSHLHLRRHHQRHKCTPEWRPSYCFEGIRFSSPLHMIEPGPAAAAYSGVHSGNTLYQVYTVCVCVHTQLCDVHYIYTFKKHQGSRVMGPQLRIQQGIITATVCTVHR